MNSKETREKRKKKKKKKEARLEHAMQAHDTKPTTNWAPRIETRGQPLVKCADSEEDQPR